MGRQTITADVLGSALGLDQIPDDELLEILSAVMTFSRWESGRRVSYANPEHGHALDLVYDKNGNIASCEPGPGMSPKLLATLREQAEAALSVDAGFIVWRDVLFSVPEVVGTWRHGDSWQILPAPPQAPRPPGVANEHPFALEHRGRASTNPWLARGRRYKGL